MPPHGSPLSWGGDVSPTFVDHVDQVDDRRRGGIIAHLCIVRGAGIGAGRADVNPELAAVFDRDHPVDEIRAVAGPARARHIAAEPVVRRGHEAGGVRMIGIAVRRAHRVVEHVFVDHRLKPVPLIARGPGGGVVPQQGDDLTDTLHLGAGEQGHGRVLDCALGLGCEGVIGHLGASQSRPNRRE